MKGLSVVDVAKPGTRWGKKTVRLVTKELNKIKHANDDLLTAEAVVAAAKNRSSPLHRYFEWDNTAAAMKYRLTQARELIRQFYVIVTVPGGQASRPVRANVVITAQGKRGYVSSVQAMNNDLLSAQIIARARIEMESWIARYSGFKELKNAVDAAKIILMKLAK